MSVKLQLPPIENEAVFSDFVLDLFNLELNATSFQYFGKKGNKQKGIDIISVEHGTAIQCKKKELTRKGLLKELKADFEATLKEIRSSEVEIKLLVFVSTFHDNAELIEHLQRLKQKYNLPFRITYRGWQSLQNSAQNYSSLLKRYFISIYSSPKILTSIPFFDPSLLLGREEILKQIEEHIDKYSLLLLQGIGGIGKTVVVSSFISDNLNKYNNVIWIENHLDSVKVNILSQLSGIISIDSRKSAESWTFLLSELRNTAGTNILVIDGVDNVNDETIRNIEEVCTTGWKVIVTSRGRLSDFPIIELETLSAEAAFKLFARYFKREINIQVLKKIVGKIDYHPLLIELLAKASNSNPKLSLEELYALILSDNLKDPSIQNLIAIGRHANKTDSTRHERIFKYLLICFRIFNLNANERKQLLYFSVLPQTIGFSFDWYLDITKQSQKHERSIVDVLNGLEDKGWIYIRKGLFSIHPLIQIVMREHIKITEAKILPVIIKCTFHLKRIQDTQAYNLCNYIFTARNILNAVSINIETIFLAQFYAQSLLRTGDYLDAIRYLEDCLTFCEHKGIDDPEFISSFMNNLGTAYLEIGQYGKAHKYLVKAIELAQMADLEKPVSLGISLDNLASIFEKLGRYEESLQLTNHAIQVFEDNEANEELSLAYVNLANTYCFLKDYKNALHFSKRAFQLLKIYYEKDGLSFSPYYNTIGLIYLKLNKPQKALTYFRKLLSIYELDKNPEDLSRAYSNIATVELMLNRLSAAKGNLDKALALQDTMGKLNVHSHAMILKNLADYYILAGRSREALVILKQVHQMFRTIFPSGHNELKNLKSYIYQLKEGVVDAEQRKIENIRLVLNEQIEKYIKRFKRLIDKFGEVKVIKYGPISDENYLHDYLFFCFTRSCKTLSSVVTLMKKNYNEDAMTLLNTVYRNYLMMNYLPRNAETTQACIMKSLFLYNGQYKYVEENGILEASLFTHPVSNKELAVFPQLSFLLQDTPYNEDIIVHRYIGTYLNEMAFSDFLMSGNYRSKDQMHYSYSEKNPNLQSEVLTHYLLLLTYSEMIKFINDEKENKTSKALFKEDLYVIEDAIVLLTFKDEMIREAMTSRLRRLNEKS